MRERFLHVQVAEKLEALSSIAHMVLDAQFTDFALREIIENRFSTNIWLSRT